MLSTRFNKEPLYNGRFIAVEGIDGAGKSHLAKWLAKRIEADGHSAILTREPGGTMLGDEIRELTLHTDAGMNGWTEAILFAADQNEHVTQIIKPALARGDYVVTDRFYGSSFGYQHGGGGCNYGDLVQLTNLAVQGCHPDIHLLLDATPSVSLRNRSLFADNYESRDIEYYENVKKGYDRVFRRGQNWAKVFVDDGTEFRNPTEILSDVCATLNEAFGWDWTIEEGETHV